MDLSDNLNPLVILRCRRWFRGYYWVKIFVYVVFMLIATPAIPLISLKVHPDGVGDWVFLGLQVMIFIWFLPGRAADMLDRPMDERHFELISLTRLYPKGLIAGNFWLVLLESITWFFAFFFCLMVWGKNLNFGLDLAGLIGLFCLSWPLIALGARLGIRKRGGLLMFLLLGPTGLKRTKVLE